MDKKIIKKTSTVTVSGGMVYLDDNRDIICHTNSLLATYGSPAVLKMPVRPGKWYTWLLRYCEADRCRCQRLMTGGRCILGLPDRPCTQELDVMRELGPVTIPTENLLCCPTERRISGGTLRLIPGSFRNAIVITVLDTEDGPMPIYVASRSPLQRIDLKPLEEIQVQPSSLAAFQSLAAPTSFVAKLRPIDLIVPHPPKSLTLRFSGPARIWLQIPAAPAKKKFRK